MLASVIGKPVGKITHAGEEYPVGLLTQAAKAGLETACHEDQLRRVRALRDSLGEDYPAELRRLLDRIQAGEFDFGSAAWLAWSRSLDGLAAFVRELIRSAGRDISRELAMEILTTEPDQVAAMVELSVQASTPAKKK